MDTGCAHDAVMRGARDAVYTRGYILCDVMCAPDVMCTRMGPTYTMRDANVMSTRASHATQAMIDRAEVVVRKAHGGEVPTPQQDEGPQTTGLQPSPPLPQPAVAAEVGMPAPVTAATSRATLGSALGVDNNAGGMNGIKVAHAMPLHIGGGEMVQQHIKAPPPPRWTSAAHSGPAFPSLAISAVPVAAPATAPSAVVAAPAPAPSALPVAAPSAAHAIP